MFERFTTRARRILVLAQEEARLLRHPVIDSSHLLLGILAERAGLGALTLGRCGVTAEAVRAKVLEIEGRGGQEPSGHIPFTSATKNILGHALAEAEALGVAYIGTASLLLGLLREDCNGSRILADLVPGGLAHVRETATALLAQGADAETA